jgi:hypothetical protein
MAKKHSKKNIKKLMAQHKRHLQFTLVLSVLLALVVLFSLRKTATELPAYVEKYDKLLSAESENIETTFKIISKKTEKVCFYGKNGKTSIGLYCIIKYLYKIDSPKTELYIEDNNKKVKSFDNEMYCSLSSPFDKTNYDMVLDCADQVNKPYFPLTNTKDSL